MRRKVERQIILLRLNLTKTVQPTELIKARQKQKLREA